ncbi:MAG: hypothetical protein MUP53_00915 [Bacteroidales bacterium]|nr:hypothetical protein [Bacteroidales bacterium]
MGLIGAVAAAVALPTGLFLENKFRGKRAVEKKNVPGFFALTLLLGSVLFLICLILAK